MQALTLETPDQPDSMNLVQLETPEPKEGEVRVKITSVGLNRGDLLYCQGRYFSKPSPGSRLGFEGAGIVDAVGPTPLNKPLIYKVGDRVALCPMSFDVKNQGCLAEFGIYAESSLIPSPEEIEDKESGAIWMAYLTAWGGLIDSGGLIAGEDVVITAASSSVGLAAIQVANMIGANSVATTTSKTKALEISKLGAKHVVTVNNTDLKANIEHYVEQVSFLTNNGSDLVFDAVAGPMSHALIKASKRGGRLIIHGLLDRKPMDIHAGVLMKRLLTIKGYTLDQTLADERKKHRAIQTLSEGFNSRVLKPTIAETFKLNEFKDAFQLLSSNSHIGKIIITP